MATYRIITDSCSDLPKDLVASLDIDVVQMTLLFRGEEVVDPTEAQIKTMYNALRQGESASTAAVNPQGWRDAVEPVLKNGQDALVLAFSSGLSTTYQSAVIAAEELMEEYPGRTVKVVDTLAASLGEGLFVYYACKKRSEGLSLEALYTWCEENKLRISHWFTVDDLMFLKRGGRISAATAMVGTMLNIKPIIHVNDEGKLINVGKVRGRKAAIEHIAAKVGELGEGFNNDTCFVVHGDCEADANILADTIKAKYGVKNVHIGYLGPVIGAHTGPGVLVVCFLGEHR